MHRSLFCRVRACCRQYVREIRQDRKSERTKAERTCPLGFHGLSDLDSVNVKSLAYLSRFSHFYCISIGLKKYTEGFVVPGTM